MFGMCSQTHVKRLRHIYRYNSVNNCRDSLNTYQEYDGSLSLATDCWTSPNHKAYLAITVNFRVEKVSKSCLLDVVELPKSHTGVHMAEAISGVIHEFGIENKVSLRTLAIVCIKTHPTAR
jgi:hypothetical protein